VTPGPAASPLAALDVDSVPDGPVAAMLLAFRGWNDAADAASHAVELLRDAGDGREFARLREDTFYDRQQLRPIVHVDDGRIASVDWPGMTFWHADSPIGGLVLGVGHEPHFRWRELCDTIGALGDAVSAQTIITFGALLADVPHTRRSPLRATCADRAVMAQLAALGIEGAEYSGPTGIAGVLQGHFDARAARAVGVWATVPHYVSFAPNPLAAAALLDAAAATLVAPGSDASSLGVDTVELARECGTYVERVNEAMADDDDVRAYVRMLEERLDAPSTTPAATTPPLVDGDLPTGDDIADELEAFLRSQEGET
jgi:predicted ATP-grasp superfamily ATP-dependent carboligase